ncbi:MAG TPA: hypothetical protein PKO06_14820, partial [Candidatus Ozemobacteraceae bacterium]|nr:hypothetical protein [Candidatus Ozemobacteraceae bacterium]
MANARYLDLEECRCCGYVVTEKETVCPGCGVRVPRASDVWLVPAALLKVPIVRDPAAKHPLLKRSWASLDDVYEVPQEEPLPRMVRDKLNEMLAQGRREIADAAPSIKILFYCFIGAVVCGVNVQGMMFLGALVIIGVLFFKLVVAMMNAAGPLSGILVTGMKALQAAFFARRVPGSVMEKEQKLHNRLRH